MERPDLECFQCTDAVIQKRESTVIKVTLTLSDFTLSTDSKNDSNDDPRVRDDPGGNAGMFFLPDARYANQIFVNTKSSDYANYRRGDKDYILYGASALRHEQVHKCLWSPLGRWI